MADRTQKCEGHGEIQPTYFEYRPGKTHIQYVHTTFPIDESLIDMMMQIADEITGVIAVMRTESDHQDQLMIVIKQSVEQTDIKSLVDTVLRKIGFRLNSLSMQKPVTYNLQSTHHPVQSNPAMAVSAASGIWHERDS